MRRLVLAFAFAAFLACSSSSSSPTRTSPPPAQDASTAPPSEQDAGDAGIEASASQDASCPTPKAATSTGETCTGFGETGDPCDPACGLPRYGYLCFNGGPPGFAGCVQVRATSLGETYCCPNNDCVAEPDQDARCSGASGKPHLYQCPPEGKDGGAAAPASDCVAEPVPGSPYPYYCCP